jgi:exosortase family protein XrtG
MIYWILGTLVWAIVGYYLHKHRIWIFYYVWTAVGLTILAILAVRSSAVEYAVEQWTGLLLHYGLSYLGIQTYIFDKAPGTVLVLLALENSWTCIDIDIECSGLLESCVLLGLLWFFPAFNYWQRVVYTLSGLIALFGINLIRLYTIVLVINSGGRDTLYIAHTLIGRLVFFLLAIAVYWYLFTRPSLQSIRRQEDNV